MLKDAFDPNARRRHEQEMIHSICSRPWDTAVPPIQVAPHVYYAGNQWVGVFWIDTGDGLILLDAGMPFQLYLIFEGMRVSGFDPRDIRLALLSHAHYDHCGAMKAVTEYTNAVCYASREDTPALLHAAGLLEYGHNYEVIAPARQYEPGERITLGRISIEPVVIGGHTPGTTCFFFSDTDVDGTSFSVGVHGGLGLSRLSDQDFQDAESAFAARRAYYQAQMMVIDRQVDIPLSFHTYNLKTLEKARAGTWRALIDPHGWKNMLESRLRDLLEIEAKSIYQAEK